MARTTKPAPIPVPAMNWKTGASIAECVVEVIGDGGDVPAAVEKAADDWQSGRATEATWATLYRWAYFNLEGGKVRGI